MVRRAYKTALVPALLFGFALPLLIACKSEKLRRPKLPPLKADSWLVDLEVAGFGKAKAAVPLGATYARPIVIALHGSADRPEWACSALRGIAGPEPFVLCPRGVQRRDLAASDPRYTFGSAEDTAAELRAALSALKQRFASHVAPGPVVFVGSEIGADHVAWIARQEPTFFSRLLLIEPLPGSWSASEAALFGRAGGQRVLFAFGPDHRADFEQKAVLTGRSGAEARALFLGDRPPSLDPNTRALLAKQWRWLSAPPTRPASVDNLAGNALPADGPAVGRPAP